MSCGNPHETPCHEVLDAVYTSLDGDMDKGSVSYAHVKVHLE